LREDKRAADVVREAPAAPARPQATPMEELRAMAAESSSTIAGITLTHPERVLNPEQGVTKRDLAADYQAVADWILPHVADRPLSLVRCPRGRSEKCFYQKHVSDSVPAAIHGVEIQEEKGSGIYVMIRDLAGLIALVQLGVLEMHPWGARADRVERPDRLVMDLDPGPGVTWKTLQEAAVEVRGVFEELGLESWLRTSGGKGLHIVAPSNAASPGTTSRASPGVSPISWPAAIRRATSLP
jgi:bifunctional non-homologous end joining protein LigD